MEKGLKAAEQQTGGSNEGGPQRTNAGARTVHEGSTGRITREREREGNKEVHAEAGGQQAAGGRAEGGTRTGGRGTSNTEHRTLNIEH